MDAFLGALEKTLAAEVQKLGHRTMEDVVAAARRIEKILEEQTDSKMERLVSSMQDQIRILRKDLKEVNEQIVTHQPLHQPRRPWLLSPPLLHQPLLPPSHRLPLLHATSTTTMGMKETFPAFLAAYHAASSVVKKDM